MECFECGQPADHNHHVIPKSLGGTNTVPLCAACHGKVHDKDFVTMNRLRLVGIEAAKERNGGRCPWGGRKKGTHNKGMEAKTAVVRAMRDADKSVAEIARTVGVTRQTVYRVLGLWERN